MNNVVYKENNELNIDKQRLIEKYSNDEKLRLLSNVVCDLIESVLILESDKIKEKYGDNVTGICPECGCIILKNKGCINCSYPKWSDYTGDIPNDNVKIDLGFEEATDNIKKDKKCNFIERIKKMFKIK